MPLQSDQIHLEPAALSLDERPSPELVLFGCLVAVFIIGSVSFRLPPYPTGDWPRAAQLVLLAIVLAATLRPSNLRAICVRAFDAPLAWAGAASILGLGLASSAAARSPRDALVDVALHVALASTAILVARHVRSAPATASVVLLVALSVPVLFFTADLLTLPRLTPDGYGLWARGKAGGFVNPRLLGTFYAVTVPLLVGAATIRALPRGLRFGLWLVAAQAWWALLVTTERAGPLALFAGGALVVVVRWRYGGWAESKRFAVTYVAAAAAGIAAGIATRVTIAMTSGVQLDSTSILGSNLSSSSGRTALWRHAADLLIDRPLLGIGPGHLAHEAYLLTPTSPTSPHNSVVRFSTEWGVPAFLVLAALIVGAAWSVRTPTGRASAWPAWLVTTELAVTTTVVAAAILSLVSGVDLTPVSQTIGSILLGWLVGLRGAAATGTVQGSHTPSSAWAALPAAIVAAAMVLLLSVLTRATPDVLQAERDAVPIVDGKRFLAPRFWIDGVIRDE